AHVHLGFFFPHSAVADLEHVGIVPVTRTGESFQAILAKTDGNHAVVIVGDVASCAPQVRAHRSSPLPHHTAPMNTEYDGPPGTHQSIMHFSERCRILLWAIDVTRAAPIVFQVIDAPGCVSFSILPLVTIAALIVVACLWAW